MQFKDLGNLFNFEGSHGIYEMFAGTFKGYTSMSDMQNVHAKLLNTEFRINAEGISEFTTAQIQAKAASMELSESLSTELIALGKDATLAQKAATGKLTWNNAIKNSGDDLEELGQTLIDSGKISDEFSEKLKDIGKVKGTSSKEYKTLIKEAVDSTDGLGDSIIDLGSSAEKTGSSIGQVFTGMVASIKPLLPAIAAVTVAIAALAAIDYSEHKYTRAYEEAETAATEYAEAQDELSNLNSELETTKEKIQELEALQANGTITFADEVELEKLQNQNDELERQVELQEALVAIKQQASASAAITASKTEQSYMEAQEEENGGFKGKLKAIFGYASFEGMSSYDATEDNGVVMKKTEAQEWAEEDTTVAGLVKTKIKELEDYEEQLKSVQEKLIEDPTNEDLRDEESKLKDDITSATEYLSEKATTLQNWIDQSVDANGKIVGGSEDYVDSWRKTLNEINNIGKEQSEIDLNNLETFFSSTSGSAVGEYLEDIVKESGTATDALDEFKRLGLSLDDIGVSEEGFIRYFEDVAKSAEEAQSAIKSVDGTFEGVQAAFESENQGANYDTQVSNLKSAQEAYENGLIGTDEFQSMAQWIAPYDIAEDLEKGLASGDYTYAAEAYKKAWEENYKKVSRWFDEDNPVKSMWNFANDLETTEEEVGKNLIDINKQTGEIVPKFETTAEAAEALGVNVEVVDTILNKMKEYGFEFDDVMFSGEALSEYKSSLEGIREIYDNMSEGASKTRLGNLLEGWDEDYEGFQEDLSSLTQEQVIHISFEYDLASIQAEIDEIVAKIEGGDNSVENNASVIAGNEKYISRAEQGIGFDVEGVEIPVQYTVNEDTISALKERLKNATSEDDKVAIQAEIENLQDVQKELLNTFSEVHPEINADSSIEEINTAWESFVDSAEGREIIAKMGADNEEAKEKVAEILGIDPEDINVSIKANDEASDTIVSVLSELMGLPEERVSNLIAKDNASDEVIAVLSSMSNIPEETLSEINATDGATSVITYVLSQILGIPESKVSDLLATDNVSNIANMVKASITDIPTSHSSLLNATDKVSSEAKTAKANVESIPSSKHITIGGSISATFNSAISKAKTALSSLGGGSNLNGTAHAGGTAGLYPIPKLSTRALAMGTLEDQSWLRNSWKTQNGEYALTGELGQEMVVFSMPPYIVICKKNFT